MIEIGPILAMTILYVTALCGVTVVAVSFFRMLGKATEKR